MSGNLSVSTRLKEATNFQKVSIFIYLDFKGIKFDSHSRKFDEPTREMLPSKFNIYLDKVKSRYE